MMRVILLGFGTVGQGLAEILRDKADALRRDYGFTAQIIGVATRTRGSLYRPDGLDPAALLHAIDAGSLYRYPDAAGLQHDMRVDAMIAAGADVLVDVSPTDLRTAEPSLSYALTALAHGLHVVMANKGPVAIAYDRLLQAAQASNRRVLFEGSVMAGTPTLRLGMDALAGCVISEARGILNGTTNFMLTHMEQGQAYADVLAEAQRLGYAEADPSADVDGWDAAGKAIILAAALFKTRLIFDEMDVSGISHLTPTDIDAARAAGERYKLIAHVTPRGGSVKATRIPLSHPLAGVSGTTNAVTFTTDELGDVTLIGAGAGRRQTGFAVLSDLLNLHIFKG